MKLAIHFKGGVVGGYGEAGRKGRADWVIGREGILMGERGNGVSGRVKWRERWGGGIPWVAEGGKDGRG